MYLRFESSTLILQGGIQKIKMEILDGICHEGGVLEGVSSATYLFWKMIFLKTI